MRPDYNFLWFKKEDRRCSLRASVSLDGKLYLGRGLRAVLPRYIRLGFDERRKVLAIAVGRAEDIELPRCGVLNVQTLACRIQATGLRLPVTFLFTKDEMTGFYLGRVLPRRRCDRATGQRRYDPEQLLILYQHVLDEAVSKIARSTPLADRRAAAREAFLEAVEGYQAGCGEWEDYLQERICKHLLAENRPHAAAYGQRSLDAPLTGEGNFCLYGTAATASSGGLQQADDRIMEEQFRASLSTRERALADLLRSGVSLARIAGTLCLSEDEAVELGYQIARKRKAFFAAT